MSSIIFFSLVDEQHQELVRRISRLTSTDGSEGELEAEKPMVKRRKKLKSSGSVISVEEAVEKQEKKKAVLISEEGVVEGGVSYVIYIQG